MSLFSKKKDIGVLAEESEYYKMEAETNGLKADALERRKVVKELEREYGSGWQKILGLTSKSSLESLKSFCTKFKTGAKDKFVVGGPVHAAPAIKPGNANSPLKKLQGIE
jgi:hypothetical protein